MSKKKPLGQVLFIINKTAGSGNHAGIEGLIAVLASRHRVAASMSYTKSPGHATVMARTAVADGWSAVVAVGGDGTVNEVAQALVDTQVSMGIVAIGSGNGLARHLGISLKPSEAMDQVFRSATQAIDTFTVNGRLSVNVSGIGFDGHIANLFGNKGSRGFLGYIKLAVSEFQKFRSFSFTIEIDGREIGRDAFILAVANSSQYGNNARIAPRASVMDGRLHMNIVKRVPPYRLDFLYGLFQGGLHQSSFCEIIELQTSARITIATNIPFHIDGEAAGKAKVFDIRIKPASLNVLIPEFRPSASSLL
ncbi:MAG TPA: YegS/Rv2252/BmrU family lipid kinase [Chryseolinea sp.]|nr:YegS/Rv2252/BmrU family lipid kinase [Chryseolinea sp.]